MANIRAQITQPTTRKDGSPFPIAELKHVLLETRADAATQWTAVGQPMAPTLLERNIQNVPGGKWWYRATWIDTQDRASDHVEASITVPISAPNGGTLTLSII